MSAPAVLPGFPAKRCDAVYPASPRGNMALRALLGPCACQRCRTPLWWAHSVSRADGSEVIGFLKWRERSGREHRCKGMTRYDWPWCPNPDPATLLCRKCGRLCEPRSNGWQHVKSICGAAMRYGETCARTLGHAADSHGKGHRTRYAMDCAASSRRAWVAA